MSGRRTAVVDDVRAYELALAERLEAHEVVAVSSGTAAIHTALASAGVGPGDRVIVAALSVIMSVAPILHLGARPVFVDSTPDGTDFDPTDLAAHLHTGDIAAVVAVHLWGRAPATSTTAAACDAAGVPVIADVCQALGTTVDGRALGAEARVACHSTHALKLLSTGEGGFLATDDPDLAARARAYRSHGLPATGHAAPASLGHNFRLAAPLAAIGAAELTRLDEHLHRRIEATRLLTELLTGTDHLEPLPGAPGWNHYAPLVRLRVPRPRAFAEHLASLPEPVPNSTGTFTLVPADTRAVFATVAGPPRCVNAAAFLDGLLAVALTRDDDRSRIRRYAEIITEEARRWVDA